MNEIDIEKLKELVNDSGKGQIIIFVNCTIENITITDSEIKIEGGEHNHHYNFTG
jgi:hypothetical protein